MRSAILTFHSQRGDVSCEATKIIYKRWFESWNTALKRELDYLAGVYNTQLSLVIILFVKL